MCDQRRMGLATAAALALVLGGCAPVAAMAFDSPAPKGAMPQPGRSSFTLESRSAPDRRDGIDGGDLRWTVEIVDVSSDDYVRFETALGVAADGGPYVMDHIEGGPVWRGRMWSVAP